MIAATDLCKFETDTWLRTLDYMQQETIQMKTCLGQAIRCTISQEALEKAEHYQSSFVNKDAVIAFLRQDIHELRTVVSSAHELQERRNLLRRDMQKMEYEFSLLRAG